MKTATLDVGGALSMLDYQTVEKQLSRIPGGSTRNRQQRHGRVRLRPSQTFAPLKDKINNCGFHCTREVLPKHQPGWYYAAEHDQLALRLAQATA